MKPISKIFFSMAFLAVLSTSCEKTEDVSKCFIHYTDETLDSKTLQVRQTIVDNPRPRTQKEIDSLFNSVSGKSYEEYGGVVCEFSKEYNRDVIVGKNGWKTMKLTRKTGTPDFNLIYLHGGAYYLNFNSNNLQASFCEKLIARMNAAIYMPLYALAPKNRVNDGFDMVLEVYKSLLKEDKPIYIMGESAGATYTLTFTQYLKSLGLQLPNAIFPISPVADATFENPEIQALEENDIVCSVYMVKSIKYWNENGMSNSDPKVSPIHGNLNGMPRTLFYIGSDEILRPDTMLLYDKMKAAGVEVGMLYGNKLWHYAVMFDVTAQEQYLNEVISFIGK